MGNPLRPIKLFLAVLLFFVLFAFQTGSILTMDRLQWILILSVILLFLWLLFERAERPDGIILAAFVGFFWDIFSSGPLGYYFSIFIVSAILLKFLLNKYVRIPFSK